MSKVLVLFAHPAHRHSSVNRQMAAVVRGIEGVSFVDLYAEYPRMKINVDREQERLLAHDIIVLQFPLLWYSTPSILKEWQDLVLEYGFAYGEGGQALSGKSLILAVSVGGPESAYQNDGYNRFEIRTLLSPLEQTAHLCGMKFLPPFCLFGALKARGEDRLDSHVAAYPKLLQGLGDGTISSETLGDRAVLSAKDIVDLAGASA